MTEPKLCPFRFTIDYENLLGLKGFGDCIGERCALFIREKLEDNKLGMCGLIAPQTNIERNYLILKKERSP